VIRLWAGLPWVHFRTEARDCSLQIIQTNSEAHAASSSMGIGGLLSWVEAAETSADHVIPSSGEVKNGWRHTCTCCMYLYAGNRDSFNVHRAVHRNISVVKPTRCTTLSELLLK